MSALPEDPQTEPVEPEQTPEPTPEPEPEAEPEPEQAPEPTPEPEPLSEKEINKRIESLERERERHTKRVSEILQEESLDLVPCEACEPAIPGFHYPAAMYPAGEPQRALYELLSGGSDAQMQHPSRYVVCDTCNGFGQVLTGARNDMNRTITCPDCKAAGYHDLEAQRAQVVPLPQVQVTGGEYAPPPPPPADTDFLGRPKGHPNYGKVTTYLTPEELAIDQRDGFAV